MTMTLYAQTTALCGRENGERLAAFLPHPSIMSTIRSSSALWAFTRSLYDMTANSEEGRFCIERGKMPLGMWQQSGVEDHASRA